MELSLYDRLGGSAAVYAAVELLYKKILADDNLSHFFEGVDIDDQKRKQREFLTMAFGGPNNYDGQDLAEAHSYMVKFKGLDRAHFDAVARHLQSVLNELNVPVSIANEIMEIAGSTRASVLGESVEKRAA